MLRAMRHGALSGVFLAILALGTFGLVLTDWQGLFRGGVSPTDVAKVGDTTLKSVNFDRLLRMNLRSQNLTTQEAYQIGIIDRVLANEINRILLFKEGREMGISVSDQVIADRIAISIQPLVAQGLSREEALNRLLQSTGLSERGLAETVRQDMTVELLASSLEKVGVDVPSFLARDILQIRKQTRSLNLLMFPHDRTKTKAPDEKTLKTFYENAKLRYTPPETRDITLLIIDPKKLEEQITVEDAQIQSYYEENVAQFTVPEKREVEQAILAEEAQAIETLDLFKTNNNMKSAVTKVTGDAKAYIGSESFEENGLLEEIAQSVFKADESTTVGPVKTPLGWHVFYLRSITPERLQPMEEAEEDIRKVLKRNLMEDELFALANDLDDRLAGGEPISELMKEFPLNQLTIKDLTRDTPDELKNFSSEDTAKIMENAFTLYEGDSTPVEELSDSRYYTLVLQKINLQNAPSFENVKAKVEKEWIDTEQMRINFKEAESLFSEIKDKKDVSLVNTSKDKRIPLKRETFKNDDTPPYGMTRETFSQFFIAKRGDVQLVPYEDGLIVAQVETIQFPSSDLLPENEVADANKALSASFKQSLFGSYLEYLRNKYDVSVNNDLLTQLYGETEPSS